MVVPPPIPHPGSESPGGKRKMREKLLPDGALQPPKRSRVVFLAKPGPPGSCQEASWVRGGQEPKGFDAGAAIQWVEGVV